MNIVYEKDDRKARDRLYEVLSADKPVIHIGGNLGESYPAIYLGRCSHDLGKIAIAYMDGSGFVGYYMYFNEYEAKRLLSGVENLLSDHINEKDFSVKYDSIPLIPDETNILEKNNFEAQVLVRKTLNDLFSMDTQKVCRRAVIEKLQKIMLALESK